MQFRSLIIRCVLFLLAALAVNGGRAEVDELDLLVMVDPLPEYFLGPQVLDNNFGVMQDIQA